MFITAEQIRSEIRPPQDADAMLVLTGHQERGRYVVLVDRTVVLLPGSRFQALVDLAWSLLTTHTGRTPIPSAGEHPTGDLARLTIHRLREDLEQSLGQDRVKDLIRTAGAGAGYFLALTRSQVATADSFFDLTAADIRSEAIEGLRRLQIETALKR